MKVETPPRGSTTDQHGSTDPGGETATKRPSRVAGMMIKISIERTEPLVGTAAAGRRAPVPFVGWLDLLRAISELVGADECAADPSRNAEKALAETAKGDPGSS